jgi:hypothetical protein
VIIPSLGGCFMADDKLSVEIEYCQD